MALLPAVDRLIEAMSLDASGEVLACSLRDLAELIDDGSASPAVGAQLHHELFRSLERLTPAEDLTAKSPRLGLLRGEPARLVLSALGYPNADDVDIDVFDRLSALQLRRRRRLAGLPPQVALDEMLEAERGDGVPHLEPSWELGEDGQPVWRDTGHPGGRAQ